MARSDQHKLALRLKVTAMLKIHARRRLIVEAHDHWRRLIRPN